MLLFFFFNDTATTEIYTLSLHDALPISGARGVTGDLEPAFNAPDAVASGQGVGAGAQRDTAVLRGSVEGDGLVSGVAADPAGGAQRRRAHIGGVLAGARDIIGGGPAGLTHPIVA